LFADPRARTPGSNLDAVRILAYPQNRAATATAMWHEPLHDPL
jgi:hypothetical protein